MKIKSLILTFHLFTNHTQSLGIFQILSVTLKHRITMYQLLYSVVAFPFDTGENLCTCTPEARYGTQTLQHFLSHA